MKIIISPAKTLDFNKIEFDKATKPLFIDKAGKIINELKKITEKDIEKSLKVNKKLASLNYKRYQNWKTEDGVNSKQAIFTYNGHLFKNIVLNKLNTEDLDYLQDNLVIISTLYGLLKPFDLIMPYRLDFLAKIKIDNQSLYEFWQNDITSYFNDLADEVIINLASNEYSKTLIRKKINKKIIDIVFKEFKNGKHKIISMSAKKMRGKFLSFMAKNKVDNPLVLKGFCDDNYKFSKEQSDDNIFTFLKD